MKAMTFISEPHEGLGARADSLAFSKMGRQARHSTIVARFRFSKAPNKLVPGLSASMALLTEAPPEG
jgi:hypothetical protein